AGKATAMSAVPVNQIDGNQRVPDETAAPAVREADATDDATWFSDRPQRLFRARLGDGGTWVVRRRPQGSDPDIYLRTFSRTPVRHATDSELAAAWFSTAFPGWSREEVNTAARKAIRRERAKR